MTYYNTYFTLHYLHYIILHYIIFIYAINPSIRTITVPNKHGPVIFLHPTDVV